MIVIIQAFILPKFNKCIGEKRLLVMGLGGTTVFLFLLSYPWGKGHAPPALYYVLMLGMFFKSYGVALISLSVLFSKILGGLPQGFFFLIIIILFPFACWLTVSLGVYMGYLTSSGSVARYLFFFFPLSPFPLPSFPLSLSSPYPLPKTKRILGPLWTVELYRLNHTGTPLFLTAAVIMVFGTVAGVCMPSVPRNHFLRSGSRGDVQ